MLFEMLFFMLLVVKLFVTGQDKAFITIALIPYITKVIKFNSKKLKKNYLD
jgi:hypothetical protein